MWQQLPRLNVLLLGADDGEGREGTRTDTVMVASIDTKTGDTALISLTRNWMRMPFPADSPLHKIYPTGFWDPKRSVEQPNYLPGRDVPDDPGQAPRHPRAVGQRGRRRPEAVGRARRSG